MEKLTISLENNKRHPLMRPSLNTLFNANLNNSEVPKITLSTTDVKYVEYLIDSKNDIRKAREVMNNLKSVAKSINELIIETDSYLASFEGVKE